MSVLSEQFGRMRKTTPEANHPHLGIKVWVDGDGYMASASQGGGSTGGSGATPEEALRDAVGSFIRLRSR